MGLIGGYVAVKSSAVYDISFQVGDLLFEHNPGESITSATEAMKVVDILRKRFLNPEVKRKITYDTVSGYIVKAPEVQNLSVADLERMVKNGDEELPTHQEPVVESDYRC